MKIREPSVPLIEALSSVWSRIRELHPDVPSVVLLPAPAGKGRRQVLGHFAALRWSAKEEADGLLHEVVVVAERLNRAAGDIVETLVHEAAHAMNFARGIKDCSPTSQYHNASFKEAAKELGLTVEKVANYGFALTSLPDATRALYDNEIARLEAVLLHRMSFVVPRPTRGEDTKDGEDTTAGDEDAEGRSRNRKAVCDCSFIIRVSRKTMEETSIVCETCGSAFRFD